MKFHTFLGADTAGLVAAVAVVIVLIGMSSSASACPDCNGQYQVESWICTFQMWEDCGGNGECDAVWADDDGCWLDCYGYYWDEQLEDCRLEYCDSEFCGVDPI